MRSWVMRWLVVLIGALAAVFVLQRVTRAANIGIEGNFPLGEDAMGLHGLSGRARAEGAGREETMSDDLLKIMGREPKPEHMGLPLEYLKGLRSDIVAEWRGTKAPTKATISRWAKRVAELNIVIAAMEAALAEQR